MSFSMPRRCGMSLPSTSDHALPSRSARAVRPVLDRAMMAAERLNYHPLINTHTTTIRSADLLRFLEALGYAPSVVDL